LTIALISAQPALTMPPAKVAAVVAETPQCAIMKPAIAAVAEPVIAIA
jgi:hypothetical protein